MTTEKATQSGKKVRAIVQELEKYRATGEPIPRGLPTKVKQTKEEEPFKDESVFRKFFGDDWDMIKRIACDPSHQFYNLVKDLLALVGNYGNMKFKENYLKYEQEHGRFKDIRTIRQSSTQQKTKKRRKKGKVYTTNIFF